MMDFLPMNKFAWVTVENLLSYTEEHILNLSDESEYGFIIQCTLEYPQSLHDDHNCLPLAPESKKVSVDMFSPYYKLLVEENGLKLKETLPKLIPNLDTKNSYVLHYRNLKFYVEKGLKLTKVEKILSFGQGPWLRKYITFNTEKRKLATNEFEKNLFKYLVNSVFGMLSHIKYISFKLCANNISTPGKTMENLRNRINFDLTSDPAMATKKASSPAFQSFTMFHHELVGIRSLQKSLTLDRPIYTGNYSNRYTPCS